MCHTQVLYLHANQIGDAGVTALAEACACGALPQCRQLWMQMNQIGDAGIIALAQAIKPVSEGGSGAMAQLQVSWRLTALVPCLETWHACSPGLTADDCKVIAHLIAIGALAQCETLDLESNKIGDVGITALASACAIGALASLKKLVVDH